MGEFLQTSAHNMLYKKITIDYELPQLIKYYTDNLSGNMFNLNNFLDIEKFNHRGSGTLGQNFFSKFPILESSIKKLFGKENYVGRFFATRPKSKGFIHIDMAHSELDPRHWSLNIPILNCHGSYHEWFSTKGDPDLVSKEANSWFWTDDTDMEPIDSLELVEPYITNVSVPHRINNLTDSVRVVFAVRTIKNEETFGFL